MGLFDKLERRLESGVNNAFAKAFRAEVQPVELASAIRRAMDDRATSAGKNKRPVVPNVFAVELSDSDFDHLTEYEADLVDELKASAAEHAETQRYTPGGPLTIQFTRGSDLETGVFKIRPQIARQAAPQASTTHPAPHQQGIALPGTKRPEPEPEADEYAEYFEAPDEPEAPRRTLAPSPAAPRSFKQRPYLDIDGDRYPLTGAITIIGRDDDVDIMLDDSGVSRRHSEIRVTNDGPHLVASLSDLGSTNGTFLNGERISSVHLTDGDRITVGRTSMLFQQGSRK